MSDKPRQPLRTCVGCRTVRPKQEMLRMVSDAHQVRPDLDGRAPGRGAYLCRSRECAEAARRRRSLERALRESVQPGAWEIIITLLTEEASPEG